MQHRTAIGCAISLVLLAVGVVALVLFAYQAVLSRRTEDDYRKLVESGATEVYSYYPEIFDRICADDELVRRITSVHLLSITPGGDYSSLARLPNVRKLDAMYCYGVEEIVPVINRMPSLKKAMFAYCGSTYSWIAELKSPTLELLEIHFHQKAEFSAGELEACKANMPSCAIKVSYDDEAE